MSLSTLGNRQLMKETLSCWSQLKWFYFVTPPLSKCGRRILILETSVFLLSTAVSFLRCSFLNFIKAVFHLTGEGNNKVRVQVGLLDICLVTLECLVVQCGKVALSILLAIERVLFCQRWHLSRKLLFKWLGAWPRSMPFTFTCVSFSDTFIR